MLTGVIAKGFWKKAEKWLEKALYPNLRFGLRFNCKYSEKDYASALVHTAMTQEFAEGALNNQRLVAPDSDVPSADSLLRYMKRFELQQIQKTFEASNDVIYKKAKQTGVFNKPILLAIDITDIPYYGDKNDPMVVGTKRKLGTNYAHRMITSNVVVSGRRFTLKAVPMDAFTPTTTVMRELIEDAKSKVKIKYVLIDRGFLSVDCMNLLKELEVEFIIPGKKNKKLKEMTEDYNGYLRLIDTYNMKSTHGKTTKLNLIATPGRRESTFFALTNVDKLHSRKVLELLHAYDKRWGIETSYRVMKDFRARTTSKNPFIRIFYFLMSCLLYNIWVLCNLLLSIEEHSCIPRKPLVPVKTMRKLYEMELALRFGEQHAWFFKGE